MTYRKYFDSHDPNGPQQFYDSIADQATSRTMGRDEKGEYVEYIVSNEPPLSWPQFLQRDNLRLSIPQRWEK